MVLSVEIGFYNLGL